MHCSLWRPHFPCGLALVLLSGCQWYSPYGYGYPNTYAPPGGMIPQQTYPMPPGALRSNPPAPAPGGRPGSQTFEGPVNPGSGSAPPWNGNSSGGAANREQPVPKYGEPDNLGGPSGDRGSTDGENKTPFSQMSGQQRDTAYAAGVQHADAADKVADMFQAPVQHDAESMRVASNGAPIPYHCDRGYKSLAGKVDYDAGDKSWHIIYNLRPEADDKFGGSIRLLDDERLRELHDQDIVEVKGEVDTEHLDANGKPQYRITELRRARPRPLAN